MQGVVVEMRAGGVTFTRGPDLPLAAQLLGRPVAEVALLLPRLFKQCRMAQGTAARMALGLPVVEDPTVEVLRDHAAKTFVTLHRTFDPDPMSSPELTAEGLFGHQGALPLTLTDFDDWLATGLPAAAPARRIDDLFPRRLASAKALPPPPEPPALGAYENSAASWQSDHPLLQAVEATQGRGPTWRCLNLLADAGATPAGGPPPPCTVGDVTVVLAARGAYALRMAQSGGLVTGLVQRAPTDHILASGGALKPALAGLYPALAPKVIALHDPFVPVTVREVQHA